MAAQLNGRPNALGESIVTESGADADAVLLFAIDRDALTALQAPLVDAARADRVAWLAYPKGGQLGTDLNRDNLWETLAIASIRPVRQVSIDEVWSALRFRPA